MNQHVSKFYIFYLTAALLWLKTYLVQRFYFNLPVESIFQEFILFITPISSIALILGIGILLSRKRRNLTMVVLSLVTSFILFSNLVFYRFFHDFITLPVLMQTSNMGDLGGSITGLMKWTDALIFIDFFILLFVIYIKKAPEMVIQKKMSLTLTVAAAVIFLVNLSLAEIVRSDLLTRTFDRQIVVKSIGTYNYHIYDVVLNSTVKSKKVFADSKDLVNAELYLKEMDDKSGQSLELFAAAKGKNVILVSMESIQDFVINREIEGQEITPFLNDLIEDSYYFSNFYHQTGQGKTSDAEFLVSNSLYPLPSGSVFFTHAQNTYESTPKILKEHGYYSAAFHANDKTFWNRDIMYNSLGFDRYLSKEYYSLTEENTEGWGLKDIDFFEQSMIYLKHLPQPFYTKFITLTNHHPFTLDEEDKFIPEFNSSSGTLNRYVTTVRYMDESIKVFFQQLKEQGLYDNSIIILYGDHYGISPNHDKAMGFLLGKEITPFESVQLQKVPMIIHIPGHEGKTVKTVSGQVDIKPTLLNLLGIESENSLNFGHDMFSKKRDSFAVLRDGSYITENHVFTTGICYSKAYGTEVPRDECNEFKDRAEKELRFSDEIIYGDLLRFIMKPEPLDAQ